MEKEISLSEAEGHMVFIPLEFITSLICDGSSFNLSVVDGIPEGAKVLRAGIHEGFLVMLFDCEVPRDITYKDNDFKIQRREVTLN